MSPPPPLPHPIKKGGAWAVSIEFSRLITLYYRENQGSKCFVKFNYIVFLWYYNISMFCSSLNLSAKNYIKNIQGNMNVCHKVNNLSIPNMYLLK